ncbi:MAG: imelysin family protein, partial [Pseudomonadota bacterium]
MKSILLATSSLVVASAAFAGGHAPSKADVLTNYSNIAEAAYGDSLATAQVLQAAVNELVTNPSAEAFAAAKDAWLASRPSYQQTEVYRFGNEIVDEWEGKVNAWPLDEGLIDYVDASYGGPTDENPAAVLNVIANPSFTLGGETVDASTIDAELLEGVLHEADGVEANVATGYHAVEFLLWGQDLNGHGPGAGERTWTDYAMGADCTNGNCDRRGEYLEAATDLLVSDLEWITEQWSEGGAARMAVM